MRPSVLRHREPKAARGFRTNLGQALPHGFNLNPLAMNGSVGLRSRVTGPDKHGIQRHRIGTVEIIAVAVLEIGFARQSLGKDHVMRCQLGACPRT